MDDWTTVKKGSSKKSDRRTLTNSERENKEPGRKLFPEADKNKNDPTETLKKSLHFSNGTKINSSFATTSKNKPTISSNKQVKYSYNNKIDFSDQSKWNSPNSNKFPDEVNEASDQLKLLKLKDDHLASLNISRNLKLKSNLKNEKNENSSSSFSPNSSIKHSALSKKTKTNPLGIVKKDGKSIKPEKSDIKHGFMNENRFSSSNKMNSNFAHSKNNLNESENSGSHEIAVESQSYENLEKKNNSAKKQLIKEKKNRLREQKARDLEDQKKRTTKFSFISSSMITDLTSIKTEHNPKSLSNKNISINDSSLEFPALPSRSSSSKSFPSGGNAMFGDKNVSEIAISKKNWISQRNEWKINDQEVNSFSNDSKLDNKEELLREVESAIQNLGSSSRKVKAKDPITIDLSDLLNKKKIASRSTALKVTKAKYNLSKTKDSTSRVTKKRGIQSENKKKKMSILRKRIQKQREKERDSFDKLLKGNAEITVAKTPNKIVPLHASSSGNNHQNVCGNQSLVANHKASASFEESQDNKDPALLNEVLLKPSTVSIASMHRSVSSKTNVSLSARKSVQFVSQSESSSSLISQAELHAEDISDIHREGSGTSDLEESLADENSSPLEDNEMKQIISRLTFLAHPVFNNSFREYCSHIVTAEINESVTTIVQSLVKFQQRLFEQDSIKAKAKRRYYCGFREALKHMSRSKCVIIAPNVRFSPGEGCLNELVTKVIESATSNQVPVIFALNRKKLSFLCRLPKHAFVSCISVVNIQGCQDNFNKLLLLVSEAVKDLQERLSAIDNSKEDCVDQ